MCGIAAFFAYHYAAPPVDLRDLRAVSGVMVQRGPDASGEWVAPDGRSAMSHRRLSIIDLSENASQPMVSDDSRFALSFNGEIYNHRQLRSDLERSGRRFRSQSDTEVILRLYEQEGVEAFKRLRGMFAVALWDGAERALILARDPYGIKPLYYADDGWTVRAASQVKALIASSRVSRDPDPAGHAAFFLFGSVPEPMSIFREVRQVPAGCWVRVGPSGPEEPRAFFSIASAWCAAPSSSPEEADASIREALTDSVDHHLVSDVEVGVFLSSGIDSSALLALASRRVQGRIKAITLSFQEFEGTPSDEAVLAAKTADLCGADHRVIRLDRGTFRASMPRALQAMDLPTIDGLNLFFVSRAAREAGLKVALCGLGADELLGGYPSFDRIPKIVTRLGWSSLLGPFNRASARCNKLLPGGKEKYAGALRYGGSEEGAYFLMRGLFMPWEISEILGEELAEEGLRRFEPLAHIRQSLGPKPQAQGARIAAMESTLYMRNQLLRDADWSSMVHSLEVRTPWADAFLLRRLAPFLTRSERLPGKESLFRAPDLALPPEILSRPKSGFSLPMQRWLEEDGSFDEWKRVPVLKRRGVHWSRKWAYVVYRRWMEGL